MRPSDLAAAARFRSELRSGAARHRRQAYEVSAADIARAIGVSRMAVSDWERAVKTPTVEHALAYGKALAALERKAA